MGLSLLARRVDKNNFVFRDFGAGYSSALDLGVKVRVRDFLDLGRGIIVIEKNSARQKNGKRNYEFGFLLHSKRDLKP